MNLPEASDLLHTLRETFGIAFTGDWRTESDGFYFDLRPDDLGKNEGFVISSVVGWRHIEVILEMEPFSMPLLTNMSQSSSEQREISAGVTRTVLADSGKVTLSINRSLFDPEEPALWPNTWTGFEVRLLRSPIVLNHHDQPELRACVLHWTSCMLGIVLPLLPTEEIIERDTAQDTFVGDEGKHTTITVNRYERNRVNRGICIAFHGTTCTVCGIDMSRVYGELGRGFIEVHHVNPVSTLEAGQPFDPAKDLVPVCPNCHAMLHRRDPPLSVQALSELVAGTRHS